MAHCLDLNGFRELHVIRDVDRGAKKLLRNVQHTGYVRVGILGDLAEDLCGEFGQLTIGELAAIHEFGLGVPQRSFIADYVDESIADIKNTIGKISKKIIRLEMDPSLALDVLGMYIEGQIKARIAKGIDPPNAPSTIARKGSSKPLIDTGQLRSSITYEVENG